MNTVASDLDTVIDLLKEHMDEIKQYSVEQIAIFGSFTRGEAGNDSDLDILVDLQRKTLRDYMGLKFYLEEITGRKVDLVMKENIKPALRQSILSEVINVEN